MTRRKAGRKPESDSAKVSIPDHYATSGDGTSGHPASAILMKIRYLHCERHRCRKAQVHLSIRKPRQHVEGHMEIQDCSCGIEIQMIPLCKKVDAEGKVLGNLDLQGNGKEMASPSWASWALGMIYQESRLIRIVNELTTNEAILLTAGMGFLAHARRRSSWLAMDRMVFGEIVSLWVHLRNACQATWDAALVEEVGLKLLAEEAKQSSEQLQLYLLLPVTPNE
ncbi:hypothetical protein BYT27DRAFT_7337365 [Phlegmacium glaucopus]|nr:hypothetical protein BYT27DRAFT_7337365 [Phlegmacium glaucopus]